jgi:hypothetical protein
MKKHEAALSVVNDCFDLFDQICSKERFPKMRVPPDNPLGICHEVNPPAIAAIGVLLWLWKGRPQVLANVNIGWPQIISSPANTWHALTFKGLHLAMGTVGSGRRGDNI